MRLAPEICVALEELSARWGLGTPLKRLLDTLGLDRAEFTPTFAAGRTAGWAAHVAEQRAKGRLIRPASRYVGPTPAA